MIKLTFSIPAAKDNVVSREFEVAINNGKKVAKRFLFRGETVVSGMEFDNNDSFVATLVDVDANGVRTGVGGQLKYTVSDLVPASRDGQINIDKKFVI